MGMTLILLLVIGTVIASSQIEILFEDYEGIPNVTKKYAFDEEGDLGSGSYGTVTKIWLLTEENIHSEGGAAHTEWVRTGEAFAMKKMHPVDPEKDGRTTHVIKTVNTEYKASRALNHGTKLSGVIYAYGKGRILDDNKNPKQEWLIVYKLCQQNLEKFLITTVRNLPKEERMIVAKFFLASVLPTFQTIHLYPMIHRDVKPENFMVDVENGKIKLLVLIDFGLAHFDGGELNSASCGTIPYQSPFAQIGLDSKTRDDIFAIICICYRIVEDRLPWATIDSDGEYHFDWNEEELIKMKWEFSENLGKAIAVEPKMLSLFHDMLQRSASTGEITYMYNYNRGLPIPLSGIPTSKGEGTAASFDYDRYVNTSANM